MTAVHVQYVAHLYFYPVMEYITKLFLKKWFLKKLFGGANLGHCLLVITGVSCPLFGQVYWLPSRLCSCVKKKGGLSLIFFILKLQSSILLAALEGQMNINVDSVLRSNPVSAVLGLYFSRVNTNIYVSILCRLLSSGQRRKWHL